MLQIIFCCITVYFCIAHFKSQCGRIQKASDPGHPKLQSILDFLQKKLWCAKCQVGIVRGLHTLLCHKILLTFTIFALSLLNLLLGFSFKFRPHWLMNFFNSSMAMYVWNWSETKVLWEKTFLWESSEQIRINVEAEPKIQSELLFLISQSFAVRMSHNSQLFAFFPFYALFC